MAFFYGPYTVDNLNNTIHELREANATLHRRHDKLHDKLAEVEAERDDYEDKLLRCDRAHTIKSDQHDAIESKMASMSIELQEARDEADHFNRLYMEERARREQEKEQRWYSASGLTFKALQRANHDMRESLPFIPIDGHRAESLADLLGVASRATTELAGRIDRKQRDGHGVDSAETDALLSDMADALGGVVHLADLLAQRCGIDLGSAVADKFNKVSERFGAPQRLMEWV